MFHVGVKKSFRAKHFFLGDFGPESEVHSHPYEAEWILSAASLDSNGYVFDISLLQEIIEKNLSEIDGRLLNELPFFESKQPSVEHLAVYLEQNMRDELRKRSSADTSLVRSTIKIWEDEGAWASYTYER